MTDEAPTLDLDAVFDRPKVKLGGKEYELRTRQEFSLLEWHRLVRMDGQGVRLLKTAGSSEEAAKKLSRMQRDLAAMLFVGGLPEGIADGACAAVIRFWTGLINADEDKKKTRESGDPQKPRRSTTAASSRGSKRSTAAGRKTGSTSRRTR